jgi:hypothetical protein
VTCVKLLSLGFENTSRHLPNSPTHPPR